MSSIATSVRSPASSSRRELRASRKHRRNQVVVRKRWECDGVELFPLVGVRVVDVDPQLVMRRIDARGGHRNEAAFVEHPAAVHNEVTNPALDRINNNSIEGSDLGSRLCAHVERFDERRLEPAVVQETELRSSSCVVHHGRKESNLRAMPPRRAAPFFRPFFGPNSATGLSGADDAGKSATRKVSRATQVVSVRERGRIRYPT